MVSKLNLIGQFCIYQVLGAYPEEINSLSQ